MSKTFKINPETFEETTRVQRHGNSRKLRASLLVKERRVYRKRILAESTNRKLFDVEADKYDDVE